MYYVTLSAPPAYSTFLSNILNNVASFVKAMGSYVILIIGVVLILFSIFQLVKAFLSAGRAAWAMILGCLLVGGFMTFGGWKILTNENLWGSFGKSTVESINAGNSPTTIGELADTGQPAAGASSTEMAKFGLSSLSKGFIVPFGKTVAVSVGVILVIIGAAQVAMHFFGNGRAAFSWAKVILICVVGSVLFTATPTNNDEGWIWLRDKVVGATKDSVENATGGSSTTQNNGWTKPGFKNSPNIPTP